MNSMYCAEQINVPPELGPILKQYTKAAIRESPKVDIYKWSANYFAGLCNQPAPFDNAGRTTTAGDAPPASAGDNAGGAAADRAMVSDVMADAEGYEAVEGGDGVDESSTDAVVAQLFNAYDVSGDGRLDRTELPALIADLKASLGLDISDDQMQEFMNLLDADDNGTIDLVEFRQLFFQSED
jgi:Ca2+-binding EF-hand superfamily protein